MSEPRLQPLALDEPLGAVYRWAGKLAALRAALAAALPRTEGAHLVGVSLAVERLVVFADSTAWCTRLRYRAPLLEAAAEPLLGLRPRLEFRTLPAAPPAPSTRISPLSTRASACLRSAARSIRDPALAAAVGRLADAQPVTGPSTGPA